TWLNEKLGITHPIIQGGMGPYSTNKLAAAVANAGGLGIISLIGMGVQHSVATPVDPKLVFGEGTTEEYLERSIAFVKAETSETGGIFGVNCPLSAEFLEAAKKLIFGTIAIRDGDPELRKRLKVIITSAGDPLPWREAIRNTDLIWFHVVPSVYHLRRTEKAGVDAVIASGHEAGAHISWKPVHSMVLIPAVVEASSLPVIGAGGICDGRTVAAALALGTVGVQMGTRFIATQESDFWDVWKQAVIKSSERDTLVARGMFGPMRFITNAASIKLVESTARLFPDFFKGQPVDLHPQLIEIEREGFARLIDNDQDGSLFLSGEVSGRIQDLPAVKDVIDRIITDAAETLRSLPRYVV
ncbi:MAG TPA: nitronate monooxygenase, partial [Desulfatiglandales bacterium]|nr:nitronate monooxygenase [Desulfatiglandales bacterium]